MKTGFLVLLALNLAVSAWLWLGGPVSVVREPGRLDQQVLPEQFRLLTDADVARRRSQAEQDAALAAANAAAAASSAASSNAGPAADAPRPACLLIANLPSEKTAGKLRADLAGLGLADRIASETDERKNRVLRLTGLDEAAAERVRELLKEYPKLALEHCDDASATH